MSLFQVGDTLSWAVDVLPCYYPGTTFPGVSSHIFAVLLWRAEFWLGGSLVATGVFGVNATDGIQTSSSNSVTILAGGTCDLGIPGSLLWSENSTALPDCGTYGPGPGHIVDTAQMRFSPDLQTTFAWDFVNVTLDNLCTQDIQLVPGILFNRIAYTSGEGIYRYNFEDLFTGTGGGTGATTEEDCSCDLWQPRSACSPDATPAIRAAAGGFSPHHCNGVAIDWVTQMSVIVTQNGIRVRGT